ncbi:MerR family transcriptional regulator [Salininema proteolyticum]|uniref:MerR family transcriptional regulator n=1 Tax=Salininema proteolyticum TaxID=1607685 RepID=A0ABV8TXQ2_9ACTN
MRIAELSRTSGVPVPSIKYYLRAGLLPPGERTARNQADYRQSHVDRLRLVRALVEVGGLSIAAVGEVLQSLDRRGDLTRSQALGTALEATLPTDTAPDGPLTDAARRTVARLSEERGWTIGLDTPVAQNLIARLASLFQFFGEDAERLADKYADIVDELAEFEVRWSVEPEDTDTAVERAVVGTFIGGAAFEAMRRLGHADYARKHLGQ